MQVDAAEDSKREWSDDKEYEFHPLAERFPLMEGEEFERLGDDVEKYGQQETVKIYEGKILDGRNRHRACRARKIPCRYELWDGKGDPSEYVLSLNLHRRHLTPQARQELVIQLRQKGNSVRQIAETLHTSVGSVHRDIQEATVPNGTVEGEKLPTTIKGKDGKMRQASKSKDKSAPAKQPKAHNLAKTISKDGATKGERPSITELIGIMDRGLGKTEEVESLEPKKNALYFVVNGYRVKVTCKIV